ncbi:hypothetical protein LSUE1_G008988 [Lachnellula suecica]|uniref:Uncharacterized protein n=1 Tax=Lachnellula suecica TaxID=602035 RepID=A0A8T9BUC5_9HELO|nr:hypothetical protein LSUE1_G008988 [Lachnellula suecica]
MPAVRKRTGPNRGKRYQGKGWRDASGDLCFQLKSRTFSHRYVVSSGITMRELISRLEYDVVSEGDYPRLAKGMEFVFFLRKRRLVESDRSVFSLFDGGETVYVEAMDGEGRVRLPIKTWNGGGREAKDLTIRGKHSKPPSFEAELETAVDSFTRRCKVQE